MLLLSNGVITRNTVALMLWRCCLAMALQLATLQRCYYGITTALLVNDGTATLLLLQHYCSTMAL